MDKRKIISKYRLLYVLVMVLFTGIIFSCSENSELEKQFASAESLMNNHPDSALAVLRKINHSSLSSTAQKARYALLMSQVLDKNYIDTTNFNILRPAIDYYLNNGSPDEKLKTLYYQGRIYQNKEDMDSAMLCFLRAGDFSESATDTLAVANLYVAQATILYKTYKFNDFIHKNLDAARLYFSIGYNEYAALSLFNALDGSILTYNKTLSDSILNKLHPSIGNNEDLKTLLNSYLTTYAISFGNKEESKEVLESFTCGDKINDDLKLSISLAYCNINDAYNASRWFNAIPKYSPTRATMRYKAIKPAVLEQNGDLKGALDAFRTFQIENDSIHQNIFSHDLLFAQERHEMEKSNLLKLQKRDRFIWLSLCVAFVLLIIIGYIYYRYRLSRAKNLLEEQENKRLQLEQENLKKENENLELRNHQAELEKQNLQQTNEKLELERHNAVLEKQKAELECERQSLAAENLRLKIEQLEDESASLKEILNKKKDLAKPIEEAIKIRIEMLNGLLAAQITDNNAYAKSYGDWRDKLIQDKDEFMNTTRLAFKASHPRFIEYLEDHGLTESEINYVCLYAIGLRGKEAGEYMQLKRHYNISSEIRSKLGLSEHNTNIGIYVRHLMKDL